MLVAQHCLSITLVLSDTIQPSFNVPLQMPFEPPRSLTLACPSRVKYNYSIGLDKCSYVQYGNEHTSPAGQNDGYKIGSQRVELAQISGLPSARVSSTLETP